MNAEYQSRLELYVSNVLAAKKGFVWKNTLIKRLAALLYAAENKAINIEAIRDCEARIKENTGLFSAFRGNSSLSAATLLSLSDNPDQLLANTLTVYGLMKEARFKSSDYLVVASCLTAAHTEPDRFALTVSRAKSFYEGMKSEHWFLTGPDDYIFAAMLGMSEIEVETGVARIEHLYDALKPDFHIGNSVQALAQVLVLGGEPTELATRVRALNDAFRAHGLKLDKQFTLSSLGTLSLLPQENDTIVREVQGTYDYLRTQQGFSKWSVTRQEMLLLSAALVAFESVDEIKKCVLTTAVSTSIVSIVIAQQTAIAVAAASSASAAASASSASC